MPTPPIVPDQTPVQFLMGGAAAQFSADCLKALAEAGINPASLGSYTYVSKVNAAARKYVKWQKGGKKGPAPELPEGIEPKDCKYLATCQSGHLVQNGVYQESGELGNPCNNVALGHSTGDYPCMPQAGHANQDGGEHAYVSRHEEDSAAEAGKPGEKYPGKKIESDADDRTDFADDKKMAARNGRKPTKARKGKQGAAAGADATAGGRAGAASGVKGRKGKKPNEPWKGTLDGETAQDCINAFRKAGEAAMRAKCADPDEIKKNREIADGKAGATKAEGDAHRKKLKKEAKKAEDAAEEPPRTKKKQRAAQNARAAATRAERADCRANQGAALRRQGPSAITRTPDGIVPQNASKEKSADDEVDFG